MPHIGITLGDQAGIGPEIVRASLERSWPDNVQFSILGEPVECSPGKPTLATAKAALQALEQGVEKLRTGGIDSIVTAPVAKQQLHQVGFDFPGQTEFFAQRMGCDNYAMCLTGPSLTVALVTIHIALAEVPRALKTSEIIRIGKLLKEFCQKRNGRPARIAVCGLNPHAGEDGAFGSEDRELIVPAIQSLNKDGTHFFGPFPPDTIFRPAVDGAYDAVLCMYHDQGLIPLKLLDFDTGVNTTLGLPRARTSPDHGTAFDIAGKGIACPKSMIEAIKLAIDLA